VIVVCDASPIIALSAVGRLSLLHQLYGKILVPEAVAQEVISGRAGQPGADDERLARRVASRLGLSVVGVLGVLLEAKKKGCLTAVRPVLDDLLTQAGFRIGSDLYALALSTAGEEPDPGAAPL
jgi:predicted nucleic acid-binding protein